MGQDTPNTMAASAWRQGKVHFLSLLHLLCLSAQLDTCMGITPTPPVPQVLKGAG